MESVGEMYEVVICEFFIVLVGILCVVVVDFILEIVVGYKIKREKDNLIL